MKKISVIFPINNPDVLNQHDLDAYQTPGYHLQLTYVNTHYRELKTAEEAAEVMPLVLDEIVKAERQGADVVIVAAFGDVGIKDGKQLVSIPVMGLGKAATHMASMLCRNYYTIIPGQLTHNSFIEALVHEENLQDKFLAASHSVQLNPAEMRNNPVLLERLIAAASAEINEKNVDTFTLGCGGFINMAKPLQQELRKRHKKPITVIDPIEVPIKVAMALCE